MNEILFNGPNVPKLRIIKKCERFNLEDKKIYFYKCKVEANKNIIFGYGVDTCEKKAKVKAFLEGLERYSLFFDKKHRGKLIFKKYNLIKDRAIHPHLLFSFLDNQYFQKDFKFSKYNNNDAIYWVKCQSFLSNKKYYVPASYVYCGYQPRDTEKKLGHSNSNGCAIGETFNRAILNATLELIERDAILIRWLNRLPSPKISIEYLSNKLKKLLKGAEKRYNVNILINDQTSDFKIPTVSVLLQSHNPPYFTFGSATNFSIELAITKALQESILIREELKNFKKLNIKYKNLNDIQTLYQHAEFYATKNKIKAFDFLSKSPCLTNLEEKKYKNIESKYNTIVKQLTFLQNFCKKNKKDIFFIDFSNQIIKEIGLHVVRVIIPGLYSLNSEYNGRYLSNKRLYSLPLKLGLKCYNLDKNNINSYPHPIG